MKKSIDTKDFTVEEKLKALYQLQLVASEIDKIKILRGELPLEVQELEDDIVGLETRLEKFANEIKDLEQNISTKKNEISEAKALIEKYKQQLDNVRNNREYDFLSKEIEFKGLEVELAEKRIKEYGAAIENKKVEIERQTIVLGEKKDSLEAKKRELEDIINETKQEEERLIASQLELEKRIDERLLTAFKRIRKNARNGLAVVPVERDACGGCFNKIPAQRQIDILQRKKIIVCEYCGRILVDQEMRTEFSKEKK